MAVKKEEIASKGKSRSEVLDLIKKSPEKFSAEFAAFFELETQSIEISKALVKYLGVDKNDLLLAHINHLKFKAHRALQNAVYSLLDYCGEINFSAYVLGTGISSVYGLIDFDHKTPDNGSSVLSLLIDIDRSKVKELFSRDVGILICSHSALDSVADAILSLLESQRIEKPNRDLAWEHIATAHNYIGQMEGIWAGNHLNIDDEIKKAISESKRNAALKRKEINPTAKEKNTAKEKIKAEWLAIHKSKKKYGFKAKFARDMQVMYPIIEDEKTITGWVTEWEKLSTS